MDVALLLADAGAGGVCEGEVFPKVYPFDLRIPSERTGCSGPENLAIIDDVGALRDAQRFANIVIRDQNADALGLQLEDDLLDLKNSDRIDARKRLVEKDERRVDRQTP